jgi:hypothetical protein
MSDTTDQVLKALAPWLARQKRPAWLPETREGDAPVTASKFAGTP